MTIERMAIGCSILLSLAISLTGCGQAAGPDPPVYTDAFLSVPAPATRQASRILTPADFFVTSTRPADPNDPPPDPDVPHNDPQTGKYIVIVDVTVTKVDPNQWYLAWDGKRRSPHQHLEVSLSNGDPVFVAHNLDLAPRVPCGVGDRLRIRGEYIVTAQDDPKYPLDVLHWTHDDPRHKHADGYIMWNGQKYG